MTSALYNRDILRLAASIPHQRRLEAPQASVMKQSPICGSRVTVDIVTDDQGRIAELGQEVRACALGQASAALMGAHALGRAPRS
jgi:NifU-like protein involved in Fe-S cluster formation